LIRVRLSKGYDYEIPVYDYVQGKRKPICVYGKYWNKGFITGGSYHISVRDLNFLIQKVERNVKDAVDECITNNIKPTREDILKLTYINEDNQEQNEANIKSGKVIVNGDGGAFASKDEFIEFIENTTDSQFDDLKKKMGVFQKRYILDYWDGFINDFAPDSYNSAKSSIEFYIKRTGDNIKAVDYSSEWLERFFRNIIDYGYSFKKDGSNPKDFSVDTLKKYKKIMISFGNYLFSEIKVLENEDFKRFELKNKKSKKKSLIVYNPKP